MLAAVPAARRPAVLTDLLPGSLLRDVALVIGGAAFVGLLAQVSFPLPGSPVPITGQTFAVLLGGAALGWRRALPAMVLYLVAGLAGVPWFAGHSTGSLHLPTLGYIVGFIAVAPLVGWVSARGGDRTPLRTAATMLVGTAVIYLFGAPWLAADLHLSGATAFKVGVRPFLVGDLLKVLLAAGLLPGTWKLLGTRRSAA